MTQAARKSQNLAALLRNHRDEIVTTWTEKVIDISDSLNRRYPLEETTNWVSRSLEAIIDIMAIGSNRALDPYLNDIANARLQAGFPIHEVTEGLLLSKEAILPILGDYFSDEPDKAFEEMIRLDTCLRQLIKCFEKVFSEEMHLQLTEEARQRLAEGESLQRTTTALLEKLTLDEVLEIVCSEARRLTGATGSAVLLLESVGWLQVTISVGKPIPALDRLPVADSLAGQVVQEGKPCLENDPVNRFQAYHRNPDLQALLVIPLRGKEGNIGVIDVVNKPGGFSDDDIRLMTLFADQAVIAIENARLHQQTEKLAVMEERQRLARELHDSVTQALYSLTLYSDAARLALSAEKIEAATGYLEELRSMAREAMLDMRLLVFELHPPILEQNGLVAALQARLEAVEARSGVQAKISVEGERRLPLDTEMELYRIAQEALTNVVKHARAQRVDLSLKYTSTSVQMEVLDNGVGFDPSASGRGGKYGLRGIEERVNQLGGHVNVKSAPGEGTTLQVMIEV